MSKWNDFQDRQAGWSNSVFGSERTALSPLYKLKQEIEELIQEPNEIEEYGDCMSLLLDAAHKSGISAERLLVQMNKKLEINKTRKWGQPDENMTFQHLTETTK